MKLRLAVMAAFVILGVAYSFATPIFEKNDEESHAWFVRHLAAGGDLPVQIPGQPESALQREGSQPPLYYWLAAPVMRLFDLSDFDAQMRPNQSPQFNPYAPNNKNLLIITPQKRAFAYEKSTLAAAVLRLLGILPGCVTIWFVYAIAYAVSRDERLALLAMGLTAFNPMFIQVMTALGNDGLVIMLSTAALHVLIQGLLNGFSAARVLIGGIVIGLAALSKVSGTLLLPVAAVAILGREWQRPSSKKLARRLGTVAAQGLGIALLWGAISGWWYVRNLQLYGDFTGTSIMAQMMTPRNFTLLDALSEFEGFRMSYIAMFGQFAVPADGIVYLAFDALLILSGIGLAAGVWREARGKKPEARGQRWEDGSQTEEGEAQRSLRMLGVGVLGLYVVLLLASVLRWTMMTPASHGRLIFPGIAGVSTLMAMGLMQFRRTWWVPGVVLVPMLVVAAIAPFRYILPGYTPPLVSAASSDLIPVQQRMGDLAEVVGYRMSPPDARPGDRVHVVVALRALRSERDDYSLVTKLYGRDNAQLARFDTFTGKGLWPSELWRAGDLMLDEVELTVPLTATAPAILKAQFELYNAGSGDIAHSVDAAGQVGAPLYDGATLLPRADLVHPASGSIARFGDLGALISVTHTEPARGQPLALSLEWEALKRADKDYTVFAHLEAADNRVVSQHDKQPLGGQFPTTRWAPGARFVDQHVLQLPADLAAGQYRIAIGLYDPATGARLPVAAEERGQGSPILNGDTLIVAEFNVR